MDALAIGYRTILIDDCSRGVDMADIEKTKNTVISNNGVIVNSEDVSFYHFIIIIFFLITGRSFRINPYWFLGFRYDRRSRQASGARLQIGNGTQKSCFRSVIDLSIFFLYVLSNFE